MNLVNRIESTLRGVDNFLNNFGTGIIKLGSISKKAKNEDNKLRKELLKLHGIPLTSSDGDYAYLNEPNLGNFNAVA